MTNAERINNYVTKHGTTATAAVKALKMPKWTAAAWYKKFGKTNKKWSRKTKSAPKWEAKPETATNINEIIARLETTIAVLKTLQ